MNLPNKLTMLRILLIPVFILFVSLPNMPAGYLVAAVVFSIASFTDYLDGAIARKRNLVTDFGKFADPLADKLLTTVAFLYMMRDGACHPVVLAIILAREFAVSGVRMVAASSPDAKVIAANMWGKVKTVLQMMTIIIYYFFEGVMRLLMQTPAQDPAAIGVIGGADGPTAIIVTSAGPFNFPGIPVMVAWIMCWVVALVTAVSGIQYIWANRQYINTAK